MTTYQMQGWTPLECHRPTEIGKIPIGSLIAFDYRPHRLIEVHERAFDLWPPAIQAEFERESRSGPESWWARVQTIALQPDGRPGAKASHRLVRAHCRLHVLPEHYAVCHRCGELPPCREQVMDRQVAEATAVMDQAMALRPGDCHACGKPVTGRHKAILFPGPNLIRPDLPDGTVIFHGRHGECVNAAYRYDERWAAAEPGRRRRFECGGRQVKHADGTIDCTEGADCPEATGPTGWTVRHREYAWHRPGVWTGDGDCWCTTGGLTARIEQQTRDGEVAP
jgi:hypothetical protein